MALVTKLNFQPEEQIWFNGTMKKLLAVLLGLGIFSLCGRVDAAINGPIKVSANGRFFVDQSRAPFFWLGDTAWPLLVQYSESQAQAYLQNRSSKGFTVIQSVLA